jgi:hypothetical protein
MSVKDDFVYRGAWKNGRFKNKSRVDVVSLAESLAFTSPITKKFI